MNNGLIIPTKDDLPDSLKHQMWDSLDKHLWQEPKRGELVLPWKKETTPVKQIPLEIFGMDYWLKYDDDDKGARPRPEEAHK